MSIFNRINKAFNILRKSSPINYSNTAFGSLYLGASQQAIRGNLEQYLRAYGENPYLYASVSHIAQAVGETVWHLYRKTADNDREEITGKHPIKDLFNHPNPTFTSADLMELNQKYIELCGKSYISYQMDKGKGELWIMPAPWLHPVTNERGDIIQYKWERGKTAALFKVEDIIPFVYNDPLNPLDGVGPAQPLGLTLDTWSYATQWNRNYFYFGADPGVIVTLDGDIPQEEADRKIEQWEARHRGYGRAHRMTLITGATKVEKAGSTIKDMDFTGLLEHNRKETLASYGMPYTMLGGTDLVQRGNAETAIFTFARWVLLPRLQFNRRHINTFIQQKFGEQYELDFDDPTPENVNETTQNAGLLFQRGIITRNEARSMVHLDEDPTEAGNEYFSQPSPFGNPFEPEKAIEGKAYSDPKAFDTEAKEAFWKRYVSNAENFEQPFMDALDSVFGTIKKDISVEHRTPLNKEAFKNVYTEKLTPVMEKVLLLFMESGMNLIKPKTPHKQIPTVLSQKALAWLRTRIGWAADEVGNTTADLLAQALEAGYAAGESIDQITDRVEWVLGGDEARARMIARTEIMTASVYGQVEGYREAGAQKVEFYPARDERECEDCQSMDGQIFAIDDSVGVLPLHPNCRCVWLPVID